MIDFIQIDRSFINIRFIRIITMEYSITIENGIDVIAYIEGEQYSRVISAHNSEKEATEALELLVKKINSRETEPQ